MPSDAAYFADFFLDAANVMQRAAAQPYGPPASEVDQKVAGEFVMSVCGDRDKAIACWNDIRRSFGGYMPAAAARTLVKVKFSPDYIVPAAAPEVS